MSMLCDVSLMFVVGLIAGCGKSDDPTRTEPSRGQPSAPRSDLGVAANRASGPCVDPVTEEEAIATFARIEDAGAEITHMCARLVPDLRAAAVGWIAYDVGCHYSGVLFRCQVYPKTFAREVLRELGWATAAPEQRVALASVWAEQIVLTDDGHQVLQSATGQFARAKQPFSPPTGAALPDGGVRVTAWIREWGMEGEFIEQREVVFAADGALVSETSIGKLDLSAPPLTRLGIMVRTEPEDSRRTADAIERKIRTNYAHGVRKCHEKELERSPAAGGELKLAFTVDGRGVVELASVEGFGNRAIDDCVKGKAAQWRLGSLGGDNGSFDQQVTVELTMTVR